MAWTSPAIAVAGVALTAAFWNTHVRDNFLAGEVALATSAGQTFGGTGANSIAARKVTAATVSATETTTSTAFTDLATVGPAVTVTTGDRALVIVTAVMANNSVSPSPPYGALISYTVSGATTIAATISIAQFFVASVNNQLRASVADLCTGLNPGSNTFTMKYASGVFTGGAGTATFIDREIIVWPF